MRKLRRPAARGEGRAYGQRGRTDERTERKRGGGADGAMMERAEKVVWYGMVMGRAEKHE
jgi:hypothetical protein